MYVFYNSVFRVSLLKICSLLQHRSVKKTVLKPQTKTNEQVPVVGVGYQIACESYQSSGEASEEFLIGK